MMTIIHGNGSTWAGGVPDPIEKLYEVLATHVLDRRLEPIFAQNLDRGVVLFTGNFLHLSHGFRIESDDPEVCENLFMLIRANKLWPDYKEQPSPAEREAERAAQVKASGRRMMYDEGLGRTRRR